MSKNGLEEEFEGFEEFAEGEYYTRLDEDREAELNGFVEEKLKVLGVELYEDTEEEGEEPVKPEERLFFDCDLYLEDNQALELYYAVAYTDPEGDPIAGIDKIFELIGQLADEGMQIIDFGEADEEEGGLAIAFGNGDTVKLVIACEAWMLSEWEPDAEGEEIEEEE
jgi:hypothetical protein